MLNYIVIYEELSVENYDDIVVVIGVILCELIIEGIDYLKVLSYIEVLCECKFVGKKVVIIGVGGIGFDIVEYLSYEGESGSLNL